MRLLSTILVSLITAIAGIASPGDTRWRLSFPQALLGTTTINTNGDCLVVTTDGTVHAVTNGAIRWSFASGSLIAGMPTVGADGAVYFGADKLYALNIDGSLRWFYSAPETNPGSEYFYTPVIGPDGALYTTKTNGPALHAIEPNGERRWLITGHFGNFGLSPVLGPGGRIYLRSGFGVCSAINSDGAMLWNQSVNTMFSSAAVSSGGDVYVGTGVGNGNGSLRAFSSNGIPIWRVDAGRIYGSPIVGPDGAVYFVVETGRAIAMESNGNFRWDYFTEGAGGLGSAFGTPAIASDGTVYFTGLSWLHALGTNGQLRWRKDVGVSAASPTLDETGTLYLAAGTNLWAIEADAPLAASQWPMYRRNSRHDGSLATGIFLPLTPTVNASSNYTDQVVVGWSSSLGAVYYDLMRSTDNTTNGLLIATNLTAIWSYSDRAAVPGVFYSYFVRARNSAGTTAWSSPAFGQRRLAEPGEVQWSVSLGTALRATPVRGPNGAIYFPTADGQMQAYSPEGALLWKRPYSEANEVCVAPEGTLYFAAARTNGGNSIFALDSSGNRLWERPLPGPVAGAWRSTQTV